MQFFGCLCITFGDLSPLKSLKQTSGARHGGLVIESKRILLKPESRKELFKRLLEHYNVETFRKLASVLGVSPGCIKKWRRGERYVPLSLVDKLPKREMILDIREKWIHPTAGNPKFPKKVRSFVYSSKASYSEIALEVKRKFGQTISKSAISYIKQNSPFRSLRYNNSGGGHDLSKLTDFEKGYIAGFFAGDGSTSSTPHRSVCFFLNKSKEFRLAQQLASLLEKANLHPHLYFPPNRNVIVVRVYSKALYEMICQYLVWEECKKTYTVRLHSIAGLSTEFAKGFIGGSADSDGGFTDWGRRYQFASVSGELIKQLTNVLTSLGICVKSYTYISKRKNRQPIHFAKISIADCEKFSMKLKFLKVNSGYPSDYLCLQNIELKPEPSMI